MEVPLQVPQGRTLWGQEHEGQMQLQNLLGCAPGAGSRGGGGGYGMVPQSCAAPRMRMMSKRCAAPCPPPPSFCAPAGTSASMAYASFAPPAPGSGFTPPPPPTGGHWGQLQPCSVAAVDSMVLQAEKILHDEAGGLECSFQSAPVKKEKKAAPKVGRSAGGLFGRIGGALFGGGGARRSSPDPACDDLFSEPIMSSACPALSKECAASCDMEMDEEESPMPLLTDEQKVAAAPLTPDQVLSLLNQRRTAAGGVPAAKDVVEALAGIAWKAAITQRGASAAGDTQQDPQRTLSKAADDLLLGGGGARPDGLASDEAWVTVLALAFLRKHLGGERGVWAGLEAKALEWLAGVWPEAVGRSIGSVVLAAMKLL